MGSPLKTERASASCAPLQTLMQTCSDSINASTIARNAGRTRSNDSGKLIPSRRGHESHVAVCGSHSAGMRYPSAVGVCELIKSTWNALRSTSNATPNSEFRSLRRTSRRRRFVNRTDNSADDDHFDQAANACVNEQFSWKRLDGVNAHTHANRCDFQQNAQADSCDYTAASETGHVDHHERN